MERDPVHSAENAAWIVTKRQPRPAATGGYTLQRHPGTIGSAKLSTRTAQASTVAPSPLAGSLRCDEEGFDPMHLDTLFVFQFRKLPWCGIMIQVVFRQVVITVT